MTRLLVALALAAAALPAAAQTSAPAEERPPSSRAAPPPSPAPRLNLKLDNPAQYSRETPRDGAGAELLPALGGDARPIPARPLSNPLDGPFPKDSQRGER
jgi:hypothetical protein